jgi:hypothetical protein
MCFHPNVSLAKDDILYNHTSMETMEKFRSNVPFKGGQKIHISTLSTLI